MKRCVPRSISLHLSARNDVWLYLDSVGTHFFTCPSHPYHNPWQNYWLRILRAVCQMLWLRPPKHWQGSDTRRPSFRISYSYAAPSCPVETKRKSSLVQHTAFTYPEVETCVKAVARVSSLREILKNIREISRSYQLLAIAAISPVT